MSKRINEMIVSMALVGAVLFSGYRLELKLNEYRIEKRIKTVTSLEVRKGRDVDFDALQERNKDVKAWIYLPDSEIDYPVVQGEDNDYYLHRDLDGSYRYEGTLFIDAACEDPFHDMNTVIYGHHMFSGTMFQNLDNYRDAEYFRDNRIIQLETPEGSYDLHVTAYCNEPADSELYMMYSGPADEWQDEDDLSYPEIVRSHAVNLSDEELSGSDRFVTLSTCAYNYKNARTQVICTLHEPAAIEKTVNTEIAEKPVNKWFVLQVIVGIIMAASVLSLPGGETIQNNH